MLVRILIVHCAKNVYCRPTHNFFVCDADHLQVLARAGHKQMHPVASASGVMRFQARERPPPFRAAVCKKSLRRRRRRVLARARHAADFFGLKCVSARFDSPPPPPPPHRRLAGWPLVGLRHLTRAAVGARLFWFAYCRHRRSPLLAAAHRCSPLANVPQNRRGANADARAPTVTSFVD